MTIKVEMEEREKPMIARRELLMGAAALPFAKAALAASPMGVATGPIEASWAGLAAGYRVPDWFRDAKFGIWAHWGPQSVPAQGDWYGRFMYLQGHPMYAHHLRTYGHPADTGFMEIQNRWTAERWDPQALVDRYKAAGARYFMALGCHHDNLDCYDSRYHPWNSLRVGPKRDVVGQFERAARKAGLKFGISNHASHAWHWYQTAYGYDPEGPRRGERYDAFRLTAADGKGRWWDGLDPQLLYTGPHIVPPAGISSIGAMTRFHDETSGRWVEHGPPMDAGYAARWLLRQVDLVEKYRPDIVYMDNYALPFGPIGLEAAADYYNRAVDWHGGTEVVLTAKKLLPHQAAGLVDDVERGFVTDIRDRPWQTCTCLGDWVYNEARLRDRSYVPAEQVIQRLADVGSKYGNLLLSVPQPGDGSLDAEAGRIVDEIGRWTAANGEAIFGSRPWRRFGEGPTRLEAGMQTEGAAKPFTAQDIRFTTNGGALYALFLKAPSGPATITALPRSAGRVERATLPGGRPVPFRQDGGGLQLDLPPGPGIVPVVRLDGEGLV